MILCDKKSKCSPLGLTISKHERIQDFAQGGVQRHHIYHIITSHNFFFLVLVVFKINKFDPGGAHPIRPFSGPAPDKTLNCSCLSTWLLRVNPSAINDIQNCILKKKTVSGTKICFVLVFLSFFKFSRRLSFIFHYFGQHPKLTLKTGYAAVPKPLTFIKISFDANLR